MGMDAIMLIPTPTKYNIFTPAAKNMDALLKNNNTAVPRSGWRKTNIIGINTNNTGMHNCKGSFRRSSGHSLKYRANVKISPSRINSDGCNEIKPKSIQRCAPIPIKPSVSTAIKANNERR